MLCRTESGGCFVANLLPAEHSPDLLRDQCAQVYERAAKLQPCGAGIFVDVNGMKALRAIDIALFNQFQAAVCEVHVPGDTASGYRAQQWRERFDLCVGLIGWFEVVQVTPTRARAYRPQRGHSPA